jgi:hypothetical protein
LVGVGCVADEVGGTVAAGVARGDDEEERLKLECGDEAAVERERGEEEGEEGREEEKRGEGEEGCGSGCFFVVFWL